MRRCAALLVVWVLLPVTPGLAEPVRIFAVGHKQHVADADTYAAFGEKMAALMDATHPARATRVQAGAGDVVSHIRPSDPAAPADALVVFPESVGLIAAFIGSRGAVARDQTTAPAAIVSLLASYDPQVQHYASVFPDQPIVRTLVTALTDTLYRSFYETFRDLAIEHGVYLAASADISPARIVREEDDPALVALLRDPDEPTRGYVYEAVTPYPVNTTFVFAPDGAVLVPDGNGGLLRSPAQTDGVIRGSTDKVYLTPLEQPPPGEAAGLALSFGSVRDMDVLDTPVGRLAIVISKDAWMVDVNDRFATKGATVFVQPEAFDSWAFTTDEWSPDVFKEGGFANLQRTPSAKVNINASMTGNLFDVTFDGQTAIIGRRGKGDAGPLGSDNAWMGQNPTTGFLALGPWIVPDPGVSDPDLGLADRRTLLVASGVNLLPGSGVACPDRLAVGACENGYREAVVWADVDPDAPAAVDDTHVPPPHFRSSVRVAPAAAPARRFPDVASKGRRVFVVWQENTATLPTVKLAISRDGGSTFGPPVSVSGRVPGAVAELHPRVAVRGRQVGVVWQEFTEGWDDDHGRIMFARFDARGRPRGNPLRVDDDDGGAWLPALAFAGRRPVVAWIDERDRGPEGEVLEHVYVAREQNGTFAPAVRVGAGEPVPLAAHVDNAWAPAIAARRRHVEVAWVGFRDYNWDVYVAVSTDGGATFSSDVRVDDFPAFERINNRPTVAIERRAVHVAWTDLRAREPDTNIFHARRARDEPDYSANMRLDDAHVGFDPDTDTPSNQWHPSLAVSGGRLFAAWQDDRDGNGDIRFATGDADSGTFGPSERVDDTGAGPSTQSRPRLSVTRHRRRRVCHVVWEDDRGGRPDVFVSRRSCAGTGVRP